MKSLARCFVWWHKLDQHLETRVKQCEQCQFSQHLPAKVPLRPWEWPERPWSRIQIDYAGPFLGKWIPIPSGWKLSSFPRQNQVLRLRSLDLCLPHMAYPKR